MVIRNERSRIVLSEEIEHEVEYRRLINRVNGSRLILLFPLLPLLSPMQLNACIRRGTIDWNLVGYFFFLPGESCVNGLQPFELLWDEIEKRVLRRVFKLILKLIVRWSWDWSRIYASLTVELYDINYMTVRQMYIEIL